MTWKCWLAILAFVVSWKVSTHEVDSDKIVNRRQWKEFETEKEARQFADDLPTWAWDVKVRKKRVGRKVD